MIKNRRRRVQINVDIDFISLTFFMLLSCSCMSQNIPPADLSITGLYPSIGKYAVGFQHYLTYDSTRTYKRLFEWTKLSSFRPIPVSIWYPAVAEENNDKTLTIKDYLRIDAEEKEWEHLPPEQLLNWFEFPNNPKNNALMDSATWSRPGALPINDQFPAILYAPSYQASSIENFSLFEFLASHGYVIISSPSRGTNHLYFDGGTTRDMETQARDLLFLFKEVSGMSNADMNKVGTMGFSFGGLSNVLAQMTHEKIRLNVSLDGSIKYQYPTLLASASADIDRVDIPFLHFSQKPIPLEVMIEDGIDTSLNSSFQFFDDLTKSEATKIVMQHLAHSQFSTLGVLLADRDPRQDLPDKQIVASYRWMSQVILNYLDAHLKDHPQARAYFNSLESDAVPFTIERKEPLPTKVSFEMFHDIARSVGYQGLQMLIDSLMIIDTGFQVQEWQINNLGLQLGFNANSYKAGIEMLKLGIHLFPQSSNLHDSLAEIYLYNKNTEQAIYHFRESLHLDSSNLNARERLDQLE